MESGPSKLGARWDDEERRVAASLIDVAKVSGVPSTDVLHISDDWSELPERSRAWIEEAISRFSYGCALLLQTPSPFTSRRVNPRRAPLRFPEILTGFLRAPDVPEIPFL